MAGRTGRGFGRPMYNPSMPKLSQFRQLVIGLLTPLSSSKQSTYPPKSKQSVIPFFQTKIPLGARIIFRLRRPNHHFINSRRDRGLRDAAPKKNAIGKVDLDNLVKFTLDALGVVVFVDDGQIAHLSTKKLWEEGGADGLTTCIVSELEE